VPVRNESEITIPSLGRVLAATILEATGRLRRLGLGSTFPAPPQCLQKFGGFGVTSEGGRPRVSGPRVPHRHCLRPCYSLADASAGTRMRIWDDMPASLARLATSGRVGCYPLCVFRLARNDQIDWSREIIDCSTPILFRRLPCIPRSGAHVPGTIQDPNTP